VTDRYDIIFFDAGETILHPHPSFHELFAKVCRDHGVVVEPDTVAELQQRLAPFLVDLASESGVDKPSLSPEDSRTFWSYLYRRFLKELGIEDEALTQRLYDVFSHPSSYALFDDVLPTLKTLLDMGQRLGLISNFEEWLEGMLVELEVGHLFDVSVISGIEGVEKPDPEIYRVALERAGTDPARGLHIGDSMTLDVEPARIAGLDTVLLDRHGRYPDVPVTRIRSLSELPELVRSGREPSDGEDVAHG
jgi:putative hydrolase of the HAD superfamily